MLRESFFLLSKRLTHSFSDIFIWILPNDQSTCSLLSLETETFDNRRADLTYSFCTQHFLCTVYVLLLRKLARKWQHDYEPATPWNDVNLLKFSSLWLTFVFSSSFSDLICFSFHFFFGIPFINISDDFIFSKHFREKFTNMLEQFENTLNLLIMKQKWETLSRTPMVTVFFLYSKTSQ